MKLRDAKDLRTGNGFSPTKRRQFTAWTALCSSLLLVIVSCEPSRNGEPVDYGPEASNSDLNHALVTPLSDLNIQSLSVGQFVHFSTTDAIAGGQVVQLESDTGQTIVDRTEQATSTEFSVVQNKYVYGGSTPQKASVEFQLNIANAAAAPGATPTPAPAASATPVPSSMPGATPSASSASMPNVASLGERIEELKSSARFGGESVLLSELQRYGVQRAREANGLHLDESRAKTSIHRLKSWETVEAPPQLVQNQPGCLGIPSCQIRVRHVSFDQVTWDTSQGTRVQFELAMSPDIPLLSGYKMSPVFEYYPGLMKSCVTLMIAVGDKGAKTLLTQCNLTENFAYKIQESSP